MVGMGLATEEQRARAFLIYRREGGRFGTALLEAGVPEAPIAAALGIQHNVAAAGPAELEEIRAEVLRFVSLRSAQRLGLVPFRREGRVLWVALKDPGDLRALDEIGLATGLEVRASVATEARIDTALAKHYGARVEPRHVAAIRLAALRKPSESAERKPSEPSTAPRRARPSTIRIIHPPVSGGQLAEPALRPPQAVPPPSRRSAAARDRADPWSGSDARRAAAVLPRDEEILDEAIQLPAAEPPPSSVPARPVPHPPEDLVPDFPEPTVEERLAEELGYAVTNEDVIDTVLEAAGHYVRRAALFVVQGELVAGWGARPEPAGDLREFRLPLSETSVFATLRDTEGFYVGTYMDLPSTVRVLRALGSDGIGTMAVVPVTLKGKTVLYLWGESESYTRPPSVPALKRLAAMMATALEIVRLKSRLLTL